MSRKIYRHPNPTNLARYLRIHKGLSMQKLGKACALHPNQICDFEHGKRGLAIGSALRLAAYLGVSLDDLTYDRYANVLPSLPPRPQRDPNLRIRLNKRRQLCDKLGCDGEAYVARVYHIYDRKRVGRIIYSAEELDRLFDFVPSDFRVLRKEEAS